MSDVTDAPLAQIDAKMCTGCHKEMPLSEFSKKGGGRLRSVCKICDRVQQKERRAANPEPQRKYDRERRKATHRKWTYGELTLPITKRCGKCKEEKPSYEFWRNSTRPDGLGHWCSDCMREYIEEWKKRKQPH